MNRFAMIAAGVVLLAAAGSAIVYFVVFSSGDVEQNAPPSPTYPAATSADDVIALEYARFKQLHALKQTKGLHPRAKALVDDMPLVADEMDFRNRVTAELVAILRQHAEGFRTRHPDLWKRHSTPPPRETRDLNTISDAVMPYCLDPEGSLGDVVNGSLVSKLKQRWGTEATTAGFRCLHEGDLGGLEDEVEEFLKLTSPVVEALNAALKKPNIYAYTTTPYDPDWEVHLPFPIHWASMIFKRIEVQLIRGDLDSAKHTTYQILELSERAQLSRGLLGSLFQVVVFQGYFIEHCVTPCAMYGALTADELEEIHQRGQAIGFDVGAAMVDEVAPKLMQYLSPSWQDRRNTGNKGIPDWMARLCGKVGVDAWFAFAETELPKLIAAFEEVLPAMLSGKYRLVTEEDYKRCQQLMTNVVVPLLAVPSSNLREMYVSQLGWVEVHIRAQELRRKQPLSAWEDPLAPFKNLNGLRAVEESNRIILFYDEGYFHSLGVEVGKIEVADDVPFIKYVKWN